MINLFRPRRTAAQNAIVGRLDRCKDIPDIIAALGDCARPVIGSDGITIIRRIGDDVAYVSEDAISPLWTGQRFPIRLCIGGMAIQARTAIVIPDIMIDKRVPLNAYLGTFVRSMAMVPIGRREPTMAMGAYWRHAQPVATATVDRMTMIADLTANAIARIEGEPPLTRQPA